MPPKRTKASTHGDSTGETATQSFRWTPENDRKLLILIQGRVLKGEDYQQLLKAFPGTNLNGVKIRTSKLRVEQRKLYTELGWDLPETNPVKKTDKKGEEGTAAVTTKGQKRGAKHIAVNEDEDEGVKKVKKYKDSDEEIGVKEEDIEGDEN